MLATIPTRLWKLAHLFEKLSPLSDTSAPTLAESTVGSKSSTGVPAQGLSPVVRSVWQPADAGPFVNIIELVALRCFHQIIPP